MKVYYALQIHGDSDICIDGEIFEDESILFKNPKSTMLIRNILKNYLEKNITPVTHEKQHCVSTFKKAISKLLQRLKNINELSDYEYIIYGGNQYVRLESKYYPEDNDFYDKEKM